MKKINSNTVNRTKDTSETIKLYQQEIRHIEEISKNEEIKLILYNNQDNINNAIVLATTILDVALIQEFIKNNLNFEVSTLSFSEKLKINAILRKPIFFLQNFTQM